MDTGLVEVAEDTSLDAVAVDTSLVAADSTASAAVAAAVVVDIAAVAASDDTIQNLKRLNERSKSYASVGEMMHQQRCSCLISA